MKRKVVYGLSGVSVAAIGVVLAALSFGKAEALITWERVDTHWHAGVWGWANNSAWWCFGYAGWHGYDRRAADVFPNAPPATACYADNTTRLELRLHVSGYRPGPEVKALGIVYTTRDSSSLPPCHIIHAQVYDVITYQYRGVYDYYHTWGPQDYQFYLWGANYWAWNSVSIGYTWSDWNCGPWQGMHAHQHMPVQGELSGPNGALYTDADGVVWNMGDWIHGWIFWTNTY